MQQGTGAHVATAGKHFEINLSKALGKAVSASEEAAQAREMRQKTGAHLDTAQQASFVYLKLLGVCGVKLLVYAALSY
jgi:hypothetical protein